MRQIVLALGVPAMLMFLTGELMHGMIFIGLLFWFGRSVCRAENSARLGLATKRPYSPKD